MSQSGRPTPRPTRAGTASNRQLRAQGRARAQRRLQLIVGASVIVLIAAAVIFISALRSSDSVPSGAGLHPFVGQPPPKLVAGAPIDGVGCGPTEGQVQHIHQHLDIVIDGKLYNHPPYVGFIPNRKCLYWIHVHNYAPGGIHVEAPVQDSFHLGAFLDIWSASPVDQTLLRTIESRRPDLVLVNGAAYGGDIRQITLGVHTLITLEYGTPHIAQSSFDFKRIE